MALPGVLGVARTERALSIRGLVAAVCDVLGRRWNHAVTDVRSAESAVSTGSPPQHGLPRPRASRRWTDPHQAPPGPFRSWAIPDDALDESQVPRHGDPWEAVFDFALSYDGHAYWYGLTELVKRVMRGWTGDESLPDDLGELRACLFYEQRRWHHFGDDPAGRSADFMWALVDAIRSCLDAMPQDQPDARRNDAGGRDRSPGVGRIVPLGPGIAVAPSPPARVELVLAAPPDQARGDKPAARVYDLRRAATEETSPPLLAPRGRMAHPSALAAPLKHAPVIVSVPCPARSGNVVPFRPPPAGEHESPGAAATVFAPDDPGYARWLRAHPEGFVVTTLGRGGAAYTRLHAAGCAAIRPTDRRGNAPGTRVCAPSAAALAAWVSSAPRHEPLRCRRCRP